MTDIAIRCEGLGKQYQIGERESYRALRDTIADTLSAPFRWLRHPRPATRDPQSASFWALRDVSFDVKHGEVVGIIGRNGAGKSTLLKILSRITKPTEGHVKINGRVGSLLEVGTGFHPELTGRENIFLNGAILGMKRAEIERKFDEIVAFAEIEKFLDTPVKRYSSGMYVRLAFAVAAHMETEILLVDEVLAVGDVEFQRKCLGKMHDISGTGRTVLFVSHNMAAMRSLCTEVVYVEAGRLIERGESHKVIDMYLAESTVDDVLSECNPIETEHFIIDSINSYRTHLDGNIVPMGSATISVKLKSKVECPDLSLRLCIEDISGARLLGVDTWTIERGIPCAPFEAKTLSVNFPSLPLAPGRYRLKIWLASYLYDYFDEIPQSIPLIIQEASMQNCQNYDKKIHGVIAAQVSIQTS